MAPIVRGLVPDQSGFTLVELLVSLVIGMLVASATFSLIEVTTQASGRITDQVGANQVGRQTLSYIENELESSCIQPGGLQSSSATATYWGPIQYGLTSPSSSTTLNSDGTDLVFWTVSDATSTTSTNSAVGTSYALHDLSYNASTGMITDTTWPVTSGTTPSTFAYGSATTTQLGDIAGKGLISEWNGTPIFEYYDYSSSTFLLTGPLTPLSSPLSTSIAPDVAQVGITFEVTGTPSDSTTGGTDSQAAPYEVSDAVDLRLTAVQNPTSTNFPYPCQ